MQIPKISNTGKGKNFNDPKIYSISNIVKFLLLSLIGVFAFFAPITVNGYSSIPIDHMVNWINQTFPVLAPIYALLIILCGAIYVTAILKETVFARMP